MAYTNSPLVDCTVKSPNHSGTRTHKIDRITPHCVVGQASAEGIGNCFPAGREASCNYGIGYDGRVCLIVDEANRSWCSSSNANDQRAITIECASDNYAPYAFKDACYKKLVELCIDICKRNGLNKVLWFGDKDKSLNYEPKAGECVLTVHRWFANKSCPGDWMYSRMGQLADEINKGLGNTTIPENKPTVDTTSLQQGSSGEKVKTLQANLNKLGYNCGTVDGIFGTQTLAAVKKFQTDKKLTVDGIVGEKTQAAITAALNTTQSTTIKAGDLVTIASNAIYWGGQSIPSWVKNDKWYVLSVDSNGRAVINENAGKTSAIMSPVDVKYLTKVGATTSAPTAKKEYKVKVTTAALHYRNGPGTNYKSNGIIRDQGVYTIVDESTGTGAKLWGKLKSGAGWIALDYTKKI